MYIHIYVCMYIYIYPPTLAFAKAGAAPGTTGGVDPVFLEPLPRPHCRQTPPQGHRNGARAPHGRSNGFFYRLPFAKPQTLQTFQLLQKFAQLRREKAPHGRSNGFFYRRSRLPFARPQRFQTLHTLDKSAQLRREKVPQQGQDAPLPHAKRPTSQASLCC